LEYLAPELVKGENQNSTVDWWTFGILIYEMMTGTTPFRADKSEEVLAKITGSERVHWEGDVGSPEARKIVKKLLHRDPKKRLGAEHGATEIKKSAWFESVNFSLIRNEQPPIIPSDVPSLSDFDGIDIDREEAGAGRESDEGDKGEKAADSSGAFAAFDMHRDETGAFTRRDGAEPGQN
jgi:protein-serine/threonine kinase